MNTYMLTDEQRRFAEANHNLVYAFLRAKRLRIDDFYDVVVFGFLRAVRNYLTRPELRRYCFSTIAWRAMASDVRNLFKKQRRKKRNAYVISLDSVGYNSGTAPLITTIPAPDLLAKNLEAIFIRHELASRVTKRQMAMLDMRAAGYSDREIAKAAKTTIAEINEQFKRVRQTARILKLEV